ncbi:MAG: hypothetical protein IPL75_14880 [Acidobacteria bacterium]|nr:hypothetical protein [Acidobacteriota bacterium]
MPATRGAGRCRRSPARWCGLRATLDARVPAVRRHGYLLATVVTKTR